MGKTKKKSTKSKRGSNKDSRGKVFFKTTGLQRISQNGNVLLNRGYTATLDDDSEDPLVINAFNNDDTYNLSVSESELNNFINELLSSHVNKTSLASRLQHDFDKIKFSDPNDMYLYRDSDTSIDPISEKYLPAPPRKQSKKKNKKSGSKGSKGSKGKKKKKVTNKKK